VFPFAKRPIKLVMQNKPLAISTYTGNNTHDKINQRVLRG